MTKYKLTFSYNGSQFFGSQFQPDKRSVEGCVDTSLEKIYSRPTKSILSGRTDTGVHSTCQVAHYETEVTIPLDKLKAIINAALPSDITVSSVETVDSPFHARHSATSRSYSYLFSPNTIPMEFLPHVSPISFEVNTDLLTETLSCFIGEHDFKAFRNTGSNEKSTIREVKSLQWLARSQATLYHKQPFDYFEIQISANSFLYRMVRNIVGATFEVLKGNASVDTIKKMLATGDRTLSYVPAKPEGLCLTQVSYS